MRREIKIPVDNGEDPDPHEFKEWKKRHPRATVLNMEVSAGVQFGNSHCSSMGWCKILYEE